LDSNDVTFVVAVADTVIVVIVEYQLWLMCLSSEMLWTVAVVDKIVMFVHSSLL